MKPVQRWFRRLGVSVSRTPDNRFDAIDASLAAMRQRGFAPTIVIDAGANRGQFFSRARPVFPEAVFHLIEPQPACIPDLEAAAEKAARAANGIGDVFVHCTALTEPGVDSVRMVGGGGETGTWVAKPNDHGPDEIVVTATTLDQLLDARISDTDRVLLKLDLEHHELPALMGAPSLLDKVEAVLSEVTFYDINDYGAPLFADVLAFLRPRRFVLYEIASLSGRARDDRLRMGDAVFVREGTTLSRDNSWN